MKVPEILLPPVILVWFQVEMGFMDDGSDSKYITLYFYAASQYILNIIYIYIRCTFSCVYYMYI